MEDFSFEISIPCDDDGFVLLQCPKCGEFFKLRPSDIESDEVLDIYCPLCGLTSEDYLTEDVVELAIAMAKNRALDEIYNEFRSLERQTRNSFVQFKCSKPEKEDELPIQSTIDAMEIVDFDCCDRQAKIRNLLHYCGSHCPFCGGLQDGNNES